MGLYVNFDLYITNENGKEKEVLEFIEEKITKEKLEKYCEESSCLIDSYSYFSKDVHIDKENNSVGICDFRVGFSSDIDPLIAFLYDLAKNIPETYFRAQISLYESVSGMHEAIYDYEMKNGELSFTDNTPEEEDYW